MSYYSYYKDIYGHDHNNEEYVKFITDRYKHSMKEFLPENKEAEILEIGCSNGMLLLSLKQLGYNNLTGVELDTELANVARSFDLNISNENLLDFFKASNKKYSLILMLDVLEHLDKKDVIDALKMINDSLEEGGKLVLTVPNASSSLGSYYRYIDWTHEVSFTAGSMIYVLNEANFKSIEIKEDDIAYLKDKEEYASEEEYNYFKNAHDDFMFAKSVARWNNVTLLDGSKLNKYMTPNLKVVATKTEATNLVLDVSDDIINLRKFYEGYEKHDELIASANSAIGNNYNLIKNLESRVNENLGLIEENKAFIQENKEFIQENKELIIENNKFIQENKDVISEYSKKYEEIMNAIHAERNFTNAKILEMYKAICKKRNKNVISKIIDKCRVAREAKYMIKHDLFDFNYYVETYDFDHSKSAIEHFLRFGMYIGNNPRADFDVFEYVCCNNEVVITEANPVILAYELGSKI